MSNTVDVKFSNCYVPIWKLRYGVVVALEINSHITYAHIRGMVTKKDGSMFIKIGIGEDIIAVEAERLTWLEPH